MSEFLPAIAYVLANEGGYCNVPGDPGGETKYGICKRDHPDVDIRNLTPEQADAIYRAQYWCFDGIQSQAVATKLLDMAINMEGSGKCGAAIRIVQNAVSVQFPNILRCDGKFGPNTALMINRCDSARLLTDMAKLCLVHYADIVDHDPKLDKFLKGWTLRAQKLPAQGATA